MRLHDLLSDELLRYAAREGDQVRLSGPDVLLLPKPAQVLSLAVHELAVNALEHGALRSQAGRIHVDWSIDGEPQGPILTLAWKETGPLPLSDDRMEGFGLKVLTETLPYETGAGTRVEFEPDGLVFTMNLPLTDKIGVPAT